MMEKNFHIEFHVIQIDNNIKINGGIKMFEMYCRHCGNKVIFNEEGKFWRCTCIDKNLNAEDIIRGYVRDARVAQLKAMHQLMCEANDEYIYMKWIYVMPDGATEEDFKDIAMDDEAYNECFDLFVKLIAKKGNRW